MLEMKQEALDRGVATIRKNYESQVKKGKLKQEQVRSARMSAAEHHAQTTTIMKDADMVIEAVFEEMGVKERFSRSSTR